jgi:hypothetical protein
MGLSLALSSLLFLSRQTQQFLLYKWVKEGPSSEILLIWKVDGIFIFIQFGCIFISLN